ncbi:hypothetical protein [Sphingobium amiense]|nr:hypothetical protein [Sphingobium amiense]
MKDAVSIFIGQPVGHRKGGTYDATFQPFVDREPSAAIDSGNGGAENCR